MKTGTAHLPLHYGKAPSWLFQRMVRLAREITTIIVEEYGGEEFLRRLSDPFWFQALGCVLGFDWHSSGLTTTVCGALKEGIKGLEKDLGLFVAGGKGGTSRNTPREIEKIGEKFSLKRDPSQLIYASRISAKVDNTALQDGYQLYHHTFIFTSSGEWAVIQQGMNIQTRWARRYHWLSTEVDDFVCEPHSAVCCNHKGRPLNLVAKESGEAREICTQLTRENPERVFRQIKRLQELNLPPHHPIYEYDLRKDAWKRIMLKAYEKQPENFEKLLGMRGVGPKTVRALALVSELVYGAKVSYRDPVKFSFAHGGKDGYPYPVDRNRYDESIQILEEATSQAKVGNRERIEALKRLYCWLR